MEGDSEEEGVAVLMAMGFEEQASREAIGMTGGEVEEAVALLLGGGLGGGEEEEEEGAAAPLKPLERPLSLCSLIRPYGAYLSSHCGYCNQSGTASHFAFTALRIHPQDYEDITDSFHLSGSWMYHPLGAVSCCKLYFIRFPVRGWKLENTPHLIMAAEKMDRFLSTRPPSQLKRRKKTDDPLAQHISRTVLQACRHIPGCEHVENVYIRCPPPDAKKRRNYSLPIASLRLKMDATVFFESFVQVWPAAEFGSVCLDGDYVVFEGLKRPLRQEEDIPSADRKEDEEAGLVLETHLEEAQFSLEKFELWCKYQKQVHSDSDSDPPEEGSFRRSYCNSPVLRMPPREGKGDHPFGLGPAHMTYRLNGELVGCAVLIFLPTQLQSIYFFWDKSRLRESSLGHYSQIKELELISREAPGILYYNLCIHCPTSKKMAYKMQYPGMEICCPFTLRWQTYDDRICALIEKHGWVRLEADESVADVGTFGADGRSKFDFRCLLAPDFVLDYFEARPYLVEEQLPPFEQRLIALAEHLKPELRAKFIINLARAE